jgi:hypothetical protein
LHSCGSRASTNLVIAAALQHPFPSTVSQRATASCCSTTACQHLRYRYQPHSQHYHQSPAPTPPPSIPAHEGWIQPRHFHRLRTSDGDSVISSPITGVAALHFPLIHFRVLLPRQYKQTSGQFLDRPTGSAVVTYQHCTSNARKCTAAYQLQPEESYRSHEVIPSDRNRKAATGSTTQHQHQFAS